jgi:hypothetical protein
MNASKIKEWVVLIIMIAAPLGVIGKLLIAQEVKRANAPMSAQQAETNMLLRNLLSGEQFDRCLKIGPELFPRPDDWREMDDEERVAVCEREKDLRVVGWAWDDCIMHAGDDEKLVKACQEDPRKEAES